jgi:hypothetical protein
LDKGRLEQIGERGVVRKARGEESRVSEEEGKVLDLLEDLLIPFQEIWPEGQRVSWSN